MLSVYMHKVVQASEYHAIKIQRGPIEPNPDWKEPCPPRAHVRREAYSKDFCTPASDAYLDVWAFGGVHLEDLLIDAPEVLLAMLHGPTMFLPFAHRYLEGQQEARALETLQVRGLVEYAVRF